MKSPVEETTSTQALKTALNVMVNGSVILLNPDICGLLRLTNVAPGALRAGRKRRPGFAYVRLFGRSTQRHIFVCVQSVFEM